MFSAAEFLDAVNARFRRRFPLWLDRPFGEFPPTWRAWFLAMAGRSGELQGAPPGDYLTVLLQRAPRPVPRALPRLTRWQTWRHLFRQQWEPPPRDQRGVRRFAAVTSGILHLFFAVALLWLGLVAIGDAPPEAAQSGEEVVEVEFIGKGTPDAQGGAPAQGDRDAAAQAGGGSTPPSPAEPPTTSGAAPPEAADAREAASPAASAPAEQPLVVTETPEPDSDFLLPPPTISTVALPQAPSQVKVPTLNAQDESVETLAAPVETRALSAPVRQPAAPRVPVLHQQETEVDMVQTPTAPAPSMPVPASPTPQLRVPSLRSVERDVELRAPPSPVAGNGTGAPSPSTAKNSGNAPNAGRSSGTSSPLAGGTPQAQGAGRAAGNAPGGAGTTNSPKPGALPTPVRGDDWGISNRNVAGGGNTGKSSGNGLLDGNGQARLPDRRDGDNVGGGLPPGTIIEDFDKIDRMGTWLKRPPLDYTPTRFDKFWLPHEDLLEEWVRRGVKTVRIPIPGTTKRIECTVSLLQGGGGCRIFDSNLQDKPATARKPPDLPFKPELQEDQQSLQHPAPLTPAPAPTTAPATPPTATPPKTP